jgi:CHRD domain
MIRRIAVAALAAVAVAALAGPVVALAQTSGDTTAEQVRYGDDIYSGTDDGYGTDSGTSTAPASGSGAWTKFIARLTGPVEVPPGDPKASGTAAVRVRGNQVCFDVKWSKGLQATASHIHKNPAGQAGAIVVPFFAQETPLGGTSKSGCTTADASLVGAIKAHPTNYYVNVHSPQFPKGAIRGQLAEASASELAFTGASRSKGLLLLGMSVVAAGSLLLAFGQRRRPAPRH